MKVDRHCKITEDYVCEDCRKEIKEKIKIQTKEKIKIRKIANEQNYFNIRKCKYCGRELINGKCLNDFCIKHHNVNFDKLSIYFGFNKTKLGTIYVEQEFQRIKDMIYELYWTKRMSAL